MRRESLCVILLVIIIIVLIPPIQPASFTIENTTWDGLSKFKTLVEEKVGKSVKTTTTPLRLIGDVNNDLIIIVGGNLPYFREESNYLRRFTEAGGNVIIFEDHGYARILTSAFGISLGGTIIDQERHERNPYLPIVNQSGLAIPGYNSSQYTVIFNKGVRVQINQSIDDTVYYPLFSILPGAIWEDKNNDGKFYRTNESVKDVCNLGGILSFNKNGGNLIVVGDSALPTNDMIDQKDNYLWLSELFSFLAANGVRKVLFDESRKLWIPPTGKAVIGIVGVLIMGAFHSPLIAIITLIVLGGIIGIKRGDKIGEVSKSILNSFKQHKDAKYIASFLQNVEEDELANLAKRNTFPDLFRAISADEIRQIAANVPLSTKIELEDYLRKRYIDVSLSNRLIKQLEKYREIDNQEGENVNGSK